MIIPCNACNGTGKISSPLRFLLIDNEDKCPTCLGTGRINIRKQLSDPTLVKIFNACQGKYFDVTELLLDLTFIQQVKKKSKNIFGQFNEDKRTLEEVEDDTMLGELGEHGILKICEQAGLKLNIMMRNLQENFIGT